MNVQLIHIASTVRPVFTDFAILKNSCFYDILSILPLRSSDFSFQRNRVTGAHPADSTQISIIKAFKIFCHRTVLLKISASVMFLSFASSRGSRGWMCGGWWVAMRWESERMSVRWVVLSIFIDFRFSFRRVSFVFSRMGNTFFQLISIELLSVTYTRARSALSSPHRQLFSVVVVWLFFFIISWRKKIVFRTMRVTCIDIMWQSP